MTRDEAVHVYETLVAFQAANGREPTLAELARACGKPARLVRWELNQLWRRKLVKWNGGRKRRGQG